MAEAALQAGRQAECIASAKPATEMPDTGFVFLLERPIPTEQSRNHKFTDGQTAARHRHDLEIWRYPQEIWRAGAARQLCQLLSTA